MTTRSARSAEATRKHVADCRKRVAKNTASSAAKNGADCNACGGTGVRQQRMKGADGSIFTMPQPCFH